MVDIGKICEYMAHACLWTHHLSCATNLNSSLCRFYCTGWSVKSSSKNHLLTLENWGTQNHLHMLWKLEHCLDISCFPQRNGSQLKKPAKVPNFKIGWPNLLTLLWHLWFIIQYYTTFLFYFVSLHSFHRPTTGIWDPYRATRRLMAMWLMILSSVNSFVPFAGWFCEETHKTIRMNLWEYWSITLM